MIQKLYYNDDIYVIGISEISNTNGLGVNQLLELASSYSKNALAIQFFNSNMIANDLHLLSAAQNAINAWSGDYMITRSLDVEIIVYASAQRQIHLALETMGVKDGLDTITVVIIDRSEEIVNNLLADIINKIGEMIQLPFLPSEEKISRLLKAFDIKEEELRYFLTTNTIADKTQALARCIASRVSLVAIGT